MCSESREFWASIHPKMEQSGFETLCQERSGLRVIIVQHNANFNDHWVSSLRHLHQLEMLVIAHSPFGDTGLEQLAKMPDHWRKHLRMVNFNDTDISNDRLEALLAFPNLGEAQLLENNIVDDHPVLARLRERGVICHSACPRHHRHFGYPAADSPVDHRHMHPTDAMH